MRKRTNQIRVVLSLLFLLPMLVNAQQNKEQKLVQIFAIIQNLHGIQFNYAEDIVKEIAIIPPSKNLSLKAVLTYLEKYTGLRFVLMNTNFVLVKPSEGLIICGYLKDKDNLYPLPNVAVQGIYNTTISDKNGYFKIKVASEKELIIISHIGYQTTRKTYNQLKKDHCEVITLKSNLFALSEVVLSDYITVGINKINNGAFEIDFSKFDILPGLIDHDVLHSIQAFPGIFSVNETVSTINIRGGTNDQNLMLWDHIKMYQSGHFFGLISMYNPQITHKVTLRKNGSDVSFTDGVSGTIDMRTDTKVTKNFTANIGMNLTDLNGFADIPIGSRSSLQIAARKSISDFFVTPTYTEFFNRISQGTEVETNTSGVSTNTDKAFDFYDTTLRWIYKMTEKDEFRINFINVSNKLLFNENAVVNLIEESRQSRLTQKSIAGAIYYKRNWNDKLQTTVEAYETDYKLKAVNANIIDAQRFLQENVVSETSLKLKADYTFNNRTKLLSGVHFVETKITNLDDVDVPVYRELISEVVRTYAVFSQLGYVSTYGNTALNFGVRLNYIEKFKKTIIEPRLSFSHRFLNDFTFELLGELKHQNTSQIINFQSDFLGIEKRRWQLSNDKEIPVITSKQISTGISFSRNGWLLSAEAYYKKVDGITAQSQGFRNQYEFIKTAGSYDATGIDLLFRKKIYAFNTWISYSYLNSLYRFKELQENAFPSNYNLSHGVSFGTTYTVSNFKVSAGFNWRTGKPTTRPLVGEEILVNEINYEATNKSVLKDYLRLDISLLYDFMLGSNVKATAGISVWNLLDKENEIDNFYHISSDVVNETIQKSLGITPNAVFRFSF